MHYYYTRRSRVRKLTWHLLLNFLGNLIESLTAEYVRIKPLIITVPFATEQQSTRPGMDSTCTDRSIKRIGAFCCENTLLLTLKSMASNKVLRAYERTLKKKTYHLSL